MDTLEVFRPEISKLHDINFSHTSHPSTSAPWNFRSMKSFFKIPGLNTEDHFRDKSRCLESVEV